MKLENLPAQLNTLKFSDMLALNDIVRKWGSCNVEGKNLIMYFDAAYNVDGGFGIISQQQGKILVITTVNQIPEESFSFSIANKVSVIWDKSLTVYEMQLVLDKIKRASQKGSWLNEKGERNFLPFGNEVFKLYGNKMAEGSEILKKSLGKLFINSVSAVKSYTMGVNQGGKNIISETLSQLSEGPGVENNFLYNL